MRRRTTRSRTPTSPRDRFSEGESELKRVLDLQPQNAKARMDLGAAYLSQEQPKEAQEEFAKLVAQEPNNADAHVGLGMALADQDNHEAAINEYKTALRLRTADSGTSITGWAFRRPN